MPDYNRDPKRDHNFDNHPYTHACFKWDLHIPPVKRAFLKMMGPLLAVDAATTAPNIQGYIPKWTPIWGTTQICQNLNAKPYKTKSLKASHLGHGELSCWRLPQRHWRRRRRRPPSSTLGAMRGVLKIGDV